MGKIVVPEGYKNPLGVIETEIAIKKIRIFFEESLCETLDLIRVSAPLFVRTESGLNDSLNEIERPVTFDIAEQNGAVCEIVHSLAKWKRYALYKYKFTNGKGLYTNMNAIRRDEETDNLHSLYVDQWDWEKIIAPKERNTRTLKEIVKKIYSVIKKTEEFTLAEYPCLAGGRALPDEITFVTTQEMEDEYPDKTPKEREDIYAEKYGAIFLIGIGGVLKSGSVHDGRAPDYDDWELNGDIIVYYPLLKRAMELSSMGIRVNKETLKNQLLYRGMLNKLEYKFHRLVMEDVLPQTIGGGIGQSRLCMFMLKKAYIGEVQASIWPEDVRLICENNDILLL